MVERSRSRYSSREEKKEIWDYIEKAEKYVKQLEPIAEETKDLKEEYDKMCKDLRSINRKFKKVEAKTRKKVYKWLEEKYHGRVK